MRRRCAALLIAVMSAVLLTACGLAATPIGGTVGCSDRKVIFLGGLLTATSSVKGAFRDIWQVLGALNLYANERDERMYFSYQYPSAYQWWDTWNVLPDKAVGALRAMVTDILTECPGASIDLIGHSLGGVVAWMYAHDYARADEGRHIAHVITLDSPVNGLSKWPAELGPPVPTVDFLLAMHGQDWASTNASLAGDLSSRLIVRTLTSMNDRIVLPPDAEISGFGIPFALGGACGPQNPKDLLLCLHGEILEMHKKSVLDAGVPDAIRCLVLATPTSWPSSPACRRWAPSSVSPEPTVAPVPLLSSPGVSWSAQPTTEAMSAAPASVSPQTAAASSTAPLASAGQSSPQLIAERVYGQPDPTSTSCNNGGVSATSLCGPLGVAVGRSGNVYIADSGNGRVLFYPRGSAVATSVYGQPNVATRTTNSSGVSATSLGHVGPVRGQFHLPNAETGPDGLAVDPAGDLYVADTNNNRVLFFPNGSTTATRVYGQPDFFSNTPNNGGVSASTLDGPQSAAVDASGNLYVADTNNNRVLFYPSDSTTATRAYGQPNLTSNLFNGGSRGRSATSLASPFGLAIDGGGDLYVADAGNDRVLFYPSGSSTATLVYGQPNFTSRNACCATSATATTLDAPLGVAVDSHGGLYVADMGNQRVLYYLQGSTTPVRVYGQPDFTSNATSNGARCDLCIPGSLALDEHGNLYIPDAGTNRVTVNPPFATSSTASVGTRTTVDSGAEASQPSVAATIRPSPVTGSASEPSARAAASGPSATEGPTQVVTFKPSSQVSKTVDGYCWTTSIAVSWRDDAWRCQTSAEHYIMDPCFSDASDSSAVLCGGPQSATSLRLLLSRPLPIVPQRQQATPNKNAWLFQLTSGVSCNNGPTGTRLPPYYKYYCNDGSGAYEDLQPGRVWTILLVRQTPDGNTASSVQAVRIVWQ